jgi:molybdate transport system substrate-binding protein
MNTHAELAKINGIYTWRTFGFIVVLSVLGGCRHSKSEQPSAPREDKLVLFAAASLREAFGQLAQEFKKSHASVEVTFNFAGTQELRTQLEQGAAADVFASADERNMKALRESAKIEDASVFAQHEPVVVVSKEKAGKIHTLADLALAERIVVGAPEVPIGKYTVQILDKASHAFGAEYRARVEAHIVSRELNVRQVLAKVALGEADAGFVYRTDIGAARDAVVVVNIPPELNVIANYPIAMVKGAQHPGLSRQWLLLVASEAGKAILRTSGFIVPSPHKDAD